MRKEILITQGYQQAIKYVCYQICMISFALLLRTDPKFKEESLHHVYGILNWIALSIVLIVLLISFAAVCLMSYKEE